ncbi:MAG: response regulator [Opitutaceae bacterium]|nr:response regulator [Opitutaceae bacterium]
MKTFVKIFKYTAGEPTSDDEKGKQSRMFNDFKKFVASTAVKGSNRALTGPVQGSVLIVDDEPDMRVIGRIALEQIGYTVAEAENGAKALEIVSDRSQNICLVVSDVLMPEMDGFGLVRKMQAICPGMPVILLSGHIVEEDLWGESNAGVRYLSKPYHLHDLQNAVIDMVGPVLSVSA